MDDIEPKAIRGFEAELLEFFRTRYSGLLAQIAETGVMDTDAVVAAIQDFKAGRKAGEET